MNLAELHEKALLVRDLYEDEREAFGELCDVVADIIEAIEVAPSAEQVDKLVEIVTTDLRPRDMRRHPYATLLQAADERRRELADVIVNYVTVSADGVSVTR